MWSPEQLVANDWPPMFLCRLCWVVSQIIEIGIDMDDASASMHTLLLRLSQLLHSIQIANDSMAEHSDACTSE